MSLAPRKYDDQTVAFYQPPEALMIGIPLGLVAANASEWLVHKYVLHGLGKNKHSFWSFHWHDHHRAVRQHDHVDPDYQASVLRWNGQGKEALALSLTALAVLPLFPIAPFFTGTLLYSTANYYRKHKRSHLDPEWAREHLPWHYDHHMGPNQHANWCVTRPWFDQLMGTRQPYLGTAKAERDKARRAARAARAAGLQAVG
jgi:hypothetical protein